MLCLLCQREDEDLSFGRHHLKTRKADKYDTVRICCDCHRTIHALFSNQELKQEYNTLEALLENKDLGQALKFIKRQRPGRLLRAKKRKN